MPDLTACEVCGMQWTAKPRELCPRCMLEGARQISARLAADAAEVKAGLCRAVVEQLVALKKRNPASREELCWNSALRTAQERFERSAGL